MGAGAKSKAAVLTLPWMALIFVMMAVIVVTAISGLNRVISDNFYIGEIADQGHYLYSMEMSFERTRVLSRDLAIYAEDTERVHQIVSNISEHKRRIEEYMQMYYSTVTSAQEAEAVESASRLIAEYYDYLSRIMEFGMLNDGDAVKALLSEHDPRVFAAADSLQMMYDLSQARLWESVDYSEHSGNTSIIMLIVVSIVAFIAVVASAIGILFAMRKTIDSMPEPQNRYDAAYPRGNNYTQADLEKIAADLKAVVWDLSQSVENLKK